jgi:hypothetical protein
MSPTNTVNTVGFQMDGNPPATNLFETEWQYGRRNGMTFFSLQIVNLKKISEPR